MSHLKLMRIGAWAAVAALAVAAGALIYQQTVGSKNGSALIEPLSAIGGPFELVNGQTGKIVTDKDFAGKPLALSLIHI